MTKIEWTERTWNPIVGCSLASPGCTNCYAMRMAYRLSKNPSTPQYHGTAKLVNGKPVFTGKLELVEKALLEPLKRKTPTTYFVNSMGDLFHENMPAEWIDQVFAVMALCPQHTFQVLTKRADRMREYVDTLVASKRSVASAAMHDLGLGMMSGLAAAGNVAGEPLPNVWLGVSTEDQKRWNERWPELARTPAAVRFVSAEPLLGPIDMIGGGKLDQVIVGGESGPNARPMHPDWARSLRDQCEAAGTAFFFKQWGEWLPWEPRTAPFWSSQNLRTDDGHVLFPADFDLSTNWDDGLGLLDYGHATFQRVGKKAAGRLLDGLEHNGFPNALMGDA